MANVVKPFTKYVLYYITGSSAQIGLAQEAEIDCFTDDWKRAGMIKFYPDSTPLPQNDNNVNGICLNYRTSRFNDVMTILKEEKPLTLNFDTDRRSGHIGTTGEPVGEQEGV